ncbi:hypothetical protein QP157_04125 [Sphingomonas sp. LR61]
MGSSSEVVGEQAGEEATTDLVQQPDGDRDRHDDDRRLLVEHRETPSRDRQPTGGSGRATVRCELCALFTHALRAVHPDCRRRLALRADRPPTALAEHEALPVRMPVAGVVRVVRLVGHAEDQDAFDVDALDDHVLDGLVTAVGGDTLDGVDHGTRLVVGDLTEDGVLALQPRRRHRGDEELRAVGATAALDAGVGHGEDVGVLERELGEISSSKR